MVDLQVLEAYKLNPDELRKKFEVPGGNVESLKPGPKALVMRIRDRVQGARDFNMSNWQAYSALDLAWDMPFKQITPTMLTTLLDKSPDDASVMETLKTWGVDLSSVLEDAPDPKTPNKNVKKISLPAFFQVYVPLVKAYVTVRWAKIVNDRRLVPFYKYEPVISDKISRMRCEAITARVEAMSRQYGYFDLWKQFIARVLHYGECLMFPIEEWHREMQEIEASADYPGEKDTQKEVNGVKVKSVIVKEGLRHHLPHPTRTYFDRAHFPSTFNTDTGCTYGGYWRVMRFRDIASNQAFYNLQVIGWADFDKWYNGSRARGFFENIYRGQSMDFPTLEGQNGGVSKLDNEKHLGRWYSNDMSDKPIVVTEHFEKIIPKEFDLSDYDKPVWFRFVIAADSTVLYCAPVSYPPIIYCGYDAMEGRTRNVSMSLEVLPFQDQFSNLLSQYLLTVRQNLTNITVVDSDIFTADEVKTIKNWGERFWRRINIFGKSGKELQKMQANAAAAVQTYRLPQLSTTDLLNAMKTILDTLERVLVMSAQEVGQAASHEQTREEVKNIQSNTSTRVTFTAAAIDIARDAHKRQIYEALMAYGSPEFYAQVAMDEELANPETLKKLGFTFDPNTFDKRSRKAVVQVNKTAISYVSFAADRDGDDRVSNAETAQAMVAMLDRAINNPMTAQAIGPEQAILILNEIARYAGFPRDFKLTNVGPNMTPEEQQNQMLQQVQQMMAEMQAAIVDDVKNAIGQINEENAAQETSIQELSVRLQALETGGAAELAPPGSLEIAT